MKDLISYSLDINIPVQNNVPEKKPFNLVDLAIDYHWPIRPLTPTESIFFWLEKLSLLVGLPTDFNCTKSDNHSDNCDIGRESNEVFWIEEMPSTDPDHTESKSHGDICSKNYYNISDGVGIQQLLLDDSKCPINNCDIGRVRDEMTWTEEIPLTNFNCTKSKSYGDNCDNNCNGNRVGGEK